MNKKNSMHCRECTKICRKPPCTCSGKPEPDFLTDAQRLAHRQAYERGETAWSAPFEPWVVRSWAKRLDEIGGFERADQVRNNILNGAKIANDPTLTTKQKIKKLTNRSRKNK